MRPTVIIAGIVILLLGLGYLQFIECAFNMDCLPGLLDQWDKIRSQLLYGGVALLLIAVGIWLAKTIVRIRNIQEQAGLPENRPSIFLNRNSDRSGRKDSR